MNAIPIEETLGLSRAAFIDRFKQWMKEFNNGELLDISVINKDGKVERDPLTCPLHFWVVYNKTKVLGKELVSTTATCPLCGSPMCPDCGNHKVEQLSRVTGYMGGVSSWNAAKQQEFKDRNRYNVGR